MCSSDLGNRIIVESYSWYLWKKMIESGQNLEESRHAETNPHDLALIKAVFTLVPSVTATERWDKPAFLVPSTGLG